MNNSYFSEYGTWNLSIDDAGKREYNRIVDSLKKKGEIFDFDIENGIPKTFSVGKQMLDHPSFYSTFEKMMRETVCREAFYMGREPKYRVKFNVEYNANNELTIAAKFGNGKDPLDFCYSTIKLDNNGNLVTQLYSTINSRKEGHPSKYEEGLYVQREVIDQNGIERADYRFEDKKEYLLGEGKDRSGILWGNVLFDELNGLCTQYYSENNKSTFTERFDDKQMLLPNVSVVTRDSQGNPNKKSTLVPIHGEYIDKLRHYNDPLAVFNPQADAYIGVSDQSYSGMKKEDIVNLYNERNAENVLGWTKTKESNPEAYEAIMQCVNGNSRRR